MKAVFCFVALVSAWSAAKADQAGECDMVGFYSELGCKPEPIAANGKCPFAFNCPELHSDPKLCYYRGVSYEDQDLIPQSEIDNTCSQSCACRVTDRATFQCAVVDCVETFDSDKEQCILTSELHSCCTTGTVCGKDDIAKLKTCDVNGETYREGQMFYPKDSRKMCLCTSEWDGSMDNVTYCQEYDCGLEIHYQDQIFEKCAPLFLENARGCPISFQCPSKTTKVVKGLNVTGAKGECAFGNLTLTVGDEATVDEACVTCECSVPPFLTCIKNTCSST